MTSLKDIGELTKTGSVMLGGIIRQASLSKTPSAYPPVPFGPKFWQRVIAKHKKILQGYITGMRSTLKRVREERDKAVNRIQAAVSRAVDAGKVS